MKLRLAQAMNQCMKKASVENITIKEICFEANCSRQTFYRCFKDKYDLINWYFDCILRISFDRMGQGRTIYDGLLKKFQYIQEESLFFHAAFSTDSQNNLRQHDFEMIYAFYLDLITKKKQYPLHSKQRDIFIRNLLFCVGISNRKMGIKWYQRNTGRIGRYPNSCNATRFNFFI